jgi:hypothetical protein
MTDDKQTRFRPAKIPAAGPTADLAPSASLRRSNCLSRCERDLIFWSRHCGSEAQVKRRDFITILGGVAIAWPLATRAQRSDKVWHIGFLTAVPPPPVMLNVFRAGLGEHGYVEGRNLSIVVRWP